jgi:hypothetical protein
MVRSRSSALITPGMYECTGPEQADGFLVWLSYSAWYTSHDPRAAATSRCLGRREVELADVSMGVRGSQHVSICLAVQIVVALETAVAAQETLVLETPHRLPDSELTHYLTRSPWRQELRSVSSYNCATPGASPTDTHPRTCPSACLPDEIEAGRVPWRYSGR